jgi:glycosyltransferase involved in cell wall biosynthesis
MTLNRPIRLAILGTRGIPARYGGFETFAEKLAVHLTRNDIEVTVYCEKEEGNQPESYLGVKLVYLPAKQCGPFTTIFFDLLCIWHARKCYDIVYMLGYGAAPFCFFPRLNGTKIWLNVDGIEWARAKWGRLARTYFKLMEFFSMWAPNRVIADAEGIKGHLKSRHWRMPPCTVIPYGAPLIECPPDSSLLGEWGLEQQRYFLVVARLEPENHVKEIIEGYKNSGTSISLVVVGNHNTGTPYINDLLQLADERVRLIGGVYDKAKLQALRYHSLAYFHGHSVGGTNPSLLEALGCGNLIIAHDNVFNREVTGDIGLYFKGSEEIPALLAEIENLSADVITDLRDQARLRIHEKYDWDKITDAYLRLIMEDVK